MPPHHPLTVVILTYNEEANLPACLASLWGLRCQVVVVDSGSQDRTVEIAQAAGATVLEHPFEHYAAQRNWAQASLPDQVDWLLHLDADERLTPQLVAEISSLMQAPPADVAGFMLRKRTIFMGRWIRHGGHYPSYHLRLFRKDLGRCEDRLYDQHFLVRGGVGRLRHDYLDVLSADLKTWTLRHARWAELEAEQALAKTRATEVVRANPMGTPIEQRRWLREGLYERAPLFVRPFLYWFYRYIIRRGFLDGKEGLIFHGLQGLWFRFLVDALIYERQRTSN